MGFRIPSARNRSLIELQKLKITTKSQIEFRLPELKLIRITNAHCYYVSPTFAKPLLSAALLSVLLVCSYCVVSWCVGLVALLHFFALVCALAKNANVLPKALAYSSVVCFFGKLKNILVKIGIKKIATVKTEIPMSAVWLDKNLLKPLSG